MFCYVYHIILLVLLVSLARLKIEEIGLTGDIRMIKQAKNTTLFIHPIRVYYDNTDAGGVVYYANYLVFMERTRTEWLRNLGLEQDTLRRQDNTLLMVRSVTIDYKKPVLFNQQIYVTMDILDKGKTYFNCYQQILSTDNELMTEATTKLVCVDAQRLQPKRLPESILRVNNCAG